MEKNYEPKCWHRVVLSASTDHKWLSMVYTNKGAESPKQNYPSLNVIWAKKTPYTVPSETEENLESIMNCSGLTLLFQAPHVSQKIL